MPGDEAGKASAAAAQSVAGDTLQVSEQRAIRTAIDACGGNLSAAARSLGIGRATLYRKLKAMEEG
ncbi:DNA-binding transcriptional regulator DhaR [compost metagenome]